MLLVDLDPQACLTFSLGVDPDEVETSGHTTCCSAGSPPTPARRATTAIDLLPATIDLAGVEAQLMPPAVASTSCGTVLDAVRDGYDVVLLDCSPTLGVLTLNALTAARRADHPDAVRDAQPPRRRPAARHRRRRAAASSTRACGCSGSCRPCTTGDNHARAVLADVGSATASRCWTADPEDRSASPRPRPSVARSSRPRRPAPAARPTANSPRRAVRMSERSPASTGCAAAVPRPAGRFPACRPAGRQLLDSVSEQQPPAPGAVNGLMFVVRRSQPGDAAGPGRPRAAVGGPAVVRRYTRPQCAARLPPAYLGEGLSPSGTTISF